MNFSLKKNRRQMMKRCDLTQVPCREAITKVIKTNKDRYFLQRTLEVADIFLQGSKGETREKMSEEDEARFFLIWNALIMDNTDDIKRTLSFSNYLLVRGFKEKAEVQEV